MSPESPSRIPPVCLVLPGFDTNKTRIKLHVFEPHRIPIINLPSGHMRTAKARQTCASRALGVKADSEGQTNLRISCPRGKSGQRRSDKPAHLVPSGQKRTAKARHTCVSRALEAKADSEGQTNLRISCPRGKSGQRRPDKPAHLVPSRQKRTAKARQTCAYRALGAKADSEGQTSLRISCPRGISGQRRPDRPTHPVPSGHVDNEGSN